jgi:SAM-dependent methyltransferase
VLFGNLCLGESILNWKKTIKSHPKILRVARYLHRWLRPIYVQPIFGWFGYIRLFKDWRRYRAAGGVALMKDFFPCLSDRTEETPFDPQYFYQAVWGAEKIWTKLPQLHVDVGSDVKFVGMLSAAVKVEFVDIRPLPVQLDNLTCREGTILGLPYVDSSVLSISSMHVIEHIGLGRYGDPIDPEGTQKACSELARVLKPGGYLYLTAPIGTPRIQFNGQRVLAIDEICDFLSGLSLVEMAWIDNYGKFYPQVAPESIVYDEVGGVDFALGCFVFTKLN